MKKISWFLFIPLFLSPILISAEEKIVISEVMPNPSGSDKNKEWIELYNLGEKERNLFNWQIKNSSQKRYLIKEKIKIPPQDYLVISLPGYFIKNKNEDLLLLNNKGEKIDYCSFKEALSGFSLIRKEDDSWQWTHKPTPGEKNFFLSIENNPWQNFENNEDKKLKRVSFLSLMISLFLSLLSVKLLRRYQS